jgi:hypothetical protein
MKKQEVDGIISLWASIFAQDDYLIVKAAVISLVSSNPNQYPPVIGTVKAAVQRLVSPVEMTESEAWEKVRKAASNSAYGSVEEFAKLPPLIQKVVGSPSALKEIGFAETSALSVLQSNFMRSYREKAAWERENARMPESVRRLGQEQRKQIEGGN